MVIVYREGATELRISFFLSLAHYSHSNTVVKAGACLMNGRTFNHQMERYFH